MEIWTKENICDYLSHPEEYLDKNYSKEREKIRKAIRAEDKKTKEDGGQIDWNYMLNDMM